MDHGFEGFIFFSRKDPPGKRNNVSQFSQMQMMKKRYNQI